MRRALTAAWIVLWAAGAAAAGEARVAVATNFLATAETVVAAFEASSPHRITLASGSTGQLYAQIVHGAPYDAFLAADDTRPRRLEDDGRAVPGSRATYAIGRLALWSADPRRVPADGARLLREGDVRRLAVAHPELAPYGAAAEETLVALGVRERLADRIVRGESVGQAHALVATGNADVGLLARSQVLEAGGSAWVVPSDLHRPIRQDAVLLRRGADNDAARAFLRFLLADAGREIVRSAGYDAE